LSEAAGAELRLGPTSGDRAAIQHSYPRRTGRSSATEVGYFWWATKGWSTPSDDFIVGFAESGDYDDPHRSAVLDLKNKEFRLTDSSGDTIASEPASISLGNYMAYFLRIEFTGENEIRFELSGDGDSDSATLSGSISRAGPYHFVGKSRGNSEYLNCYSVARRIIPAQS
jgi:hypothetical protein